MEKFTLKYLLLTLVTCLVTCLVSCQKSDGIEDEKPLAPEIVYDPSYLYTAKVGESVRIEPEYKNSEDADYLWKINSEVVAETPYFDFVSDEAGEYYISLSVVTDGGKDTAKFAVKVSVLNIPVVELFIPEEGFTSALGAEFVLSPTVVAEEPVDYVWQLDGADIAQTKDLSYTFETVGEYTLKFIASTTDGKAEIETAVSVVSLEDMPFKWTFDATTYNVSAGRELRLKIWDIENDLDADYVWSVDGEEVQRGKLTEYIFSSSVQGEHIVTVEAENSVTQSNPSLEYSMELSVNVCPSEGTYRRAVSASSSSDFSEVIEFLAAPGQYVNEMYSVTTMEEACEYAEKQLQGGQVLSLGAYGGYIVFGFDHSIENDGDYNIAIKGNPHAGSSEPGIVMVMQDENGDGKPNDTWYELKGSEMSAQTYTSDYSITYYKPSESQVSIQWSDSMGERGEVDYLVDYHAQDTYFPLWYDGVTLTFRGTRLNARTSQSGANWVHDSFPWGYVDNFSDEDLTPEYGNLLKISNAVDYKGDAVNLQYIDFVKVYTAVNAKAGWLGELSTEVVGIKDYNMVK